MFIVFKKYLMYNEFIKIVLRGIKMSVSPVIIIIAVLAVIGVAAAIAISRISKNKKKVQIEPVEISKEELEQKQAEERRIKEEKECEEVAAIMAAIQAFMGEKTAFQIRRIIKKADGSLLWNAAGVKQNNDSSIYNVNH